MIGITIINQSLNAPFFIVVDKYNFNPSKKLLLPFATSQTIVSALPAGKESPDSTEQCTGEEPGPE